MAISKRRAERAPPLIADVRPTTVIPLPALIVALLGVTASPTVATYSVTTIDALCADVTKMAQNRAPQRIFANFADAYDRNAPDDWRAVSDMAELTKLAETTYPYTQAFVWSDDDTTLVTMFFTSPSSDWALYDEHCFDSTGTLVRNVGTLNTFNAVDPTSDASAGVSRIRTTHYNSLGATLQSETRLLDLETKEPKPQMQYMDQEDLIYLKLSALPLSKLMSK